MNHMRQSIGLKIQKQYNKYRAKLIWSVKMADSLPSRARSSLIFARVRHIARNASEPICQFLQEAVLAAPAEAFEVKRAVELHAV